MDSYAQDARKLFHKAYPPVQQGNRETEEMGKAVLAYQFVSGLRPEIRRKLVGMEGSFDQLLRDLMDSDTKPTQKRVITSSTSSASTDSMGEGRGPFGRFSNTAKARPPLRCFHCHGTGHFARDCPFRGRVAPAESRGRGYASNRSQGVAALTAQEESDEREKHAERIERLQQEVREAEMEGAMGRAMTTMRVFSTGDSSGLSMGPTLTTMVQLEGIPVEALLDTGSPITIVSLDFLMSSLATQRPKEQSVEDWKQAVKDRVVSPTVALRGYGGGGINIIGQLECTISQGPFSQTAMVLIQKRCATGSVDRHRLSAIFGVPHS